MSGFLSGLLKKKESPVAAETQEPDAAPAEEIEQSPHYLNVHALKDVFGEALEEDVEEIEAFTHEDEVEDISLEEIEEETPPPLPKSKRLLRRSFYSTVGIVVIVLSIIGLISTVNYAVNLAHNIADNTSLKDEFASFLFPVVVIDPPTFESAQQLSDSTVINAAIWNIVLNQEDIAKYPTEFDMMTVPELDVEASAIRLFGSGLTFNHQTVGYAEMAFTYNPETKSYLVPKKPLTLPYAPVVDSFTRVADTYILHVGYMPPSHAWSNLTSNLVVEPDKYMEYTVTLQGDKMTLISIDQIAVDTEQ